jgi:C1A family cysteine protease
LSGYVSKPRKQTVVSRSEGTNASDIDWRNLKAVSYVKNQGHCGSCWAFSTTGSIETNTEIKHGNYISLSEQQLVDCSDLNHGCNGGEYDPAFKYAADFGMLSENDYPYLAVNSICAYDASKVVNKHINIPAPYTDINPGDIDTFLNLLAKGPISIAIEADQHVYHFYTGGIIADNGACGENLDHAVLAVGHGT